MPQGNGPSEGRTAKSPGRKAGAGSLAGLLAFTLRPYVAAQCMAACQRAAACQHGALACFSRLAHKVGRNSGTVETLAPEFRRFFSQVCTWFYVVADDRTFYAQERKAYSCEVAFYRNTGTRETLVPEFRWAAGQATGYGTSDERRVAGDERRATGYEASGERRAAGRATGNERRTIRGIVRLSPHAQASAVLSDR